MRGSVRSPRLLGRYQPSGVGDEAAIEGGFSLIEMVVVVSILMLVMGALLGALESMTTSERRTSSRVDDEQNIRFVAYALTRDLRAANPVLVTPAVPGLHNEVDLCLGDVVGTSLACAAGQTQVRWVYDSAAATLTRYTVVGLTQTSTQVLSGVANASTAPVFAWYGRAHAGDLAVAPDMSPTDVANCAASVQVTIVAGSRVGLAPITESSEVGLRNQGGGPGCS